MNVIKKPTNTSFQAKIDYASGIKISDKFTKYKVFVLYDGENRNRTIIDKSIAESKLVKDFGYTPVIGHWDPELEDFKAHGDLKMNLDEEGNIVFEKTNISMYGIVPENPEIFWEVAKDENGIEHNYLCTYAYLYNRFKELEVLKEGLNHQSMELNPETLCGSYLVKNGIEYFNIEDGEIIGLCILGKNVEPCFESAKFDPVFSLTNDFCEALKNIKEELKKDLTLFELIEETPDDIDIINNPEPELEPQLILNEDPEPQPQPQPQPEIIEEPGTEPDLKIQPISTEEFEALKLENENLKATIDSYKEKLIILNDLSEDMADEDYKLILESINDLKIEEIKLQAQDCVIKYIKAKNPSTEKRKSKEEYCLILNNGKKQNSTSIFNEGSWQAAVAQKQLKNGGIK